MSRVSPLLIVKSDYDPGLHGEMAQPRYDHERMHRQAAILIGFCPAFSLLIGAEYIAHDLLFLALTVLVVLLAYATGRNR